LRLLADGPSQNAATGSRKSPSEFLKQQQTLAAGAGCKNVSVHHRVAVIATPDGSGSGRHNSPINSSRHPWKRVL
jgi:hypothetical protein